MSKIVYDSRVGGVRPRPGDPIPTPAYYLTFNVKAQNCVTKKHFKVKIVDLHNEYGIILLKQKVNLNGCMGGPTNWGDEFTGKLHTLTVEGLKQGKPFKMLNSAFVQTTPPRP